MLHAMWMPNQCDNASLALRSVQKGTPGCGCCKEVQLDHCQTGRTHMQCSNPCKHPPSCMLAMHPEAWYVVAVWPSYNVAS